MLSYYHCRTKKEHFSLFQSENPHESLFLIDLVIGDRVDAYAILFINPLWFCDSITF